MKPATLISGMQRQFSEAGASEKLNQAMIEFTIKARESGVEFAFTCVYRSNEEQAKLYAKGRTESGAIVTNAKPGQSEHNRTENGLPASNAFDCAPIIDGSITWSTKGHALEAWEKLGFAAEHAGLRWGRHFRRLGFDWCHFELPHQPMLTEGTQS